MPYKLQTHPTQPRGGHPSHSNLVRGKLTSPTPNPAGDGTSGLTSYPRRRSKVSEATCLRPQRSAPSRTRTRAVRPRVQRSDHWATHASLPRQGVRQFSSRLIPTFGEFHHIVRNDEFITAILQNGQWCKVNNTDF